MKISEKYKHIGYSYPSVPEGWLKIVEKAIVDIEKEMWPRWIPMFIKRIIHYLATGKFRSKPMESTAKPELKKSTANIC